MSEESLICASSADSTVSMSSSSSEERSSSSSTQCGSTLSGSSFSVQEVSVGRRGGFRAPSPFFNVKRRYFAWNGNQRQTKRKFLTYNCSSKQFFGSGSALICPDLDPVATMMTIFQLIKMRLYSTTLQVPYLPIIYFRTVCQLKVDFSLSGSWFSLKLMRI